MTQAVRAQVLFDGEAKGRLLKLEAPICFWGGLDSSTGQIADPQHPDYQACITGKILAIPRIVGSSSSSQILLETLHKKTEPAAIILGEAEAIIAVAVLVARELGFGTIPILHGKLDDVAAGSQLEISKGGLISPLDGN